MFTPEDIIRSYENDGFSLIPECLSVAEVAGLRSRLPRLLETAGPQRVFEKDGAAIRSIYGPHLSDDLFDDVAHDSRILGLAQRILGDDVYIYQSKINLKKKLCGDMWAWHQDYIFWLQEDAVLQPDLTTAVVFLDDVDESNGPMLFVPGSHKEGVAGARVLDAAPAGYENDPAWISNLTADLKYSIDAATLAMRMAECGVAAPQGRRGSLMFLHANVFHSSQPNLSSRDRVLLLITYNSIHNIPKPVANPRPEFLCSRNTAAVRVNDRFCTRVAPQGRCAGPVC